MTRRNVSRLFRRAIEEDEEPEEEEIGRVLGASVYGDPPHLRIHAQLFEERSYTQRFLEAIQSRELEPELFQQPELIPESYSPEAPRSLRNTTEIRMAETETLPTIYIDEQREATLIIQWGTERYTVHFPIKGEGELTHDVPVGRVEWIVETREEEEEEDTPLEELGEEELEELLDNIGDDDYMADDYGDEDDDDGDGDFYDDDYHDDEDDDY